MSTTYIELRPNSTRLGNWMFQYAAAKSMAQGEPVAFLIREGQDVQAVEKFRGFFPDVAIVRNVPEGVEVLTGLFQDVKYLDEKIVKGLFKIRDEYRGRVSPGIVSIHVRRGDYLRFPHRHPFVGKRYLREAVARFPDGTQFLVFSDDVPWCKGFFKGGQFHYSTGKSAVDDLMLMSWCDHHICSNSTFSWWGAYLRFGGRTIFPSMWYGPCAEIKDWSGLYFKGSEVISNRYEMRALGAVAYHALRDWIGRGLRRVGLR